MEKSAAKKSSSTCHSLSGLLYIQYSQNSMSLFSLLNLFIIYILYRVIFMKYFLLSLKKEQGNSEVSSDQGNKMAEGPKDATSCEGTYEVVERHVRVGSLGALVEAARTTILVDKNGRPSPQLLKLMWEILREVSNLHDRGEAHGHLCRENILICWESRKTELQKGLPYYAVLKPDSPCLKSSETGCNVSVRQASEQRKDHALSANIYSLGEIFHYCISGQSLKLWETGRNERDLPTVDCPAAKDLILRSQEEKPELRPKANELLNHPLFWTPEKRVSFLCDVHQRPSDSKYSNLRSELQKLSVERVTGGKWDEHINDENVLRYILEQKSYPEEACNYNFHSVRDLVGLIRNMKVHYRELPRVVKRSVGTLYEDFDSFFTSRFPNLVIEVYKVVRKFCKKDEYFCRYFSGDALVGY